MVIHWIRFTAAALGIAVALGAADKKAAAPKTPPATSGSRVFVDPATGKIREPEHDEVRALTPARAATRTLALPALPLAGPGGAIGMRLDESHMVFSVAKKNPDGSVTIGCVHGKDAKDGAHSHAAPAGRQTDVK